LAYPHAFIPASLALLWLALAAACTTPPAVASSSITPVQATPVAATASPPTPIVLTAVAVSTTPALSNIATPILDETPTLSSLVSPQAITLQDNEEKILLQTGDRFLLNLGENYDWTVQVEDPSVVERVIGITVVRGAQGVYEAKSSGQTRLSATGDLPCRKTKPPCMAPSILFEVSIVVG
jgi:hypothetical protein